MNKRDDAEIDAMKQLLRSAIQPAPEGAIARNLWPRMLARMTQLGPRWTIWDWAAVAAAGAAVAAFPAALGIVSYGL
jgi:hypothetical protein